MFIFRRCHTRCFNCFNVFLKAILVLSIAGCSEAKKTNVQSIVGQWKSEYLYVKMNSYKSSDSTVITDVNPKNYTEVTGLKTAIVDYQEDGSYEEKYISPDGSTAYSQSGYWFMKNDTIIMAIYKPLKNQSVQKYHVKLEEDKGTFTSLMDYDGDGQEDDEFKGISKRIQSF